MKISQEWWCALVTPATQEAEAGESLEPRRQRLQRAEIMPLIQPGKRARLCLKKEEETTPISSGIQNKRELFQIYFMKPPLLWYQNQKE